MKTYKSFSSEETRKFGEAMAKDLLVAKHTGRARIFALKGDLGAGKTTFTQGLIKGLGSKRRATSPTFVIMRRHALKNARHKNIFHIDAYRLATAEHLAVLGFKEIAADAKNIIVIEWPERAKKILPKHTTWIEFRHGKKENERTIILKR